MARTIRKALKRTNLEEVENKVTDNWNKVKTNPVPHAKSLTEYIKSVNESVERRADLVDTTLLPEESAAGREIFGRNELAQNLYALRLKDPLDLSPALKIAANSSLLTGTLPADASGKTVQDQAFILELRQQAGAQLSRAELTTLNTVIRSQLGKYFSHPDSDPDYFGDLADKFMISPDELTGLQKRYLDACQDLSANESKEGAAKPEEQSKDNLPFLAAVFGGSGLTMVVLQQLQKFISHQRAKSQAQKQASEQPVQKPAESSIRARTEERQSEHRVDRPSINGNHTEPVHSPVPSRDQFPGGVRPLTSDRPSGSAPLSVFDSDMMLSVLNTLFATQKNEASDNLPVASSPGDSGEYEIPGFGSTRDIKDAGKDHGYGHTNGR